ncbi:hypothetical protein PAXRUDRAFT_36833 [Paxillus rubicundulus Ve08.2h10]|uniref:ATP-dependent DNA helicase n=1 Tax=Paxillus rubicundulus Ve08.2h10 TaxID=930991 RepID=A0A0D0D0L3_9AGAM|nr:hypothetical protein PAXRUDRAFT_36833 [Paxillus rubicundulus Ve08.2h10]
MDDEMGDDDMNEDGHNIELTEADLQVYKESQKNQCEEQHGKLAISIARSKGIIRNDTATWSCQSTDISIAHENDYLKLHMWQASMETMITDLNGEKNGDIVGLNGGKEDIGTLSWSGMDAMDADLGEGTGQLDGGVQSIAGSLSIVQDHLTLVEVSYNIIDWHLNETLTGTNPPQLLMIIPGEGGVGLNLPFGGINMILVGDFHQFPPVTGRPLYWLIDPAKDDAEELLGRSLYEQFKTVCVINAEWLDLLRHICNGSCHAQHIKILCSLIITNPQCPPTDFKLPAWNEAVLITQHHSTSNHGNKQDEQGGLSNTITLKISMKVMVMFNVETDLNIANGARGEVVKIILSEHKTPFLSSQPIIQLTYYALQCTQQHIPVSDHRK